MRVLLSKAAYIRGHKQPGPADVEEHEFDPAYMVDVDGVLESAGPVEAPADPEPAEDPAEEMTREEHILSVLFSLDHNDDALWTDAGLVRMDVLEKALGDTSVTRGEVEAVAPGFKREL